jgi:hypothetical protein
MAKLTDRAVGSGSKSAPTGTDSLILVNWHFVGIESHRNSIARPATCS